MFADLPPDCSALVAQTSAGPATASAEDQARYLKLLLARQECERLSEVGWSPIEQVAARRREVRRVTYQHGHLTHYVPAVALEKTGDGVVTVRLNLQDQPQVLSAAVPPALWTDLTGLSTLRRPGIAPTAPPSHCDLVIIEGAQAGDSWRRQILACDNRQKQAEANAITYAYRLATIAIDYIPACAPAKAKAANPSNPWAVLMDCGGKRPSRRPPG